MLGFAFFKIYVCIKKIEESLKILSLQRINMKFIGKYQNVKRNGMHHRTDGMRLKWFSVPRSKDERVFDIGAYIF